MRIPYYHQLDTEEHNHIPHYQPARPSYRALVQLELLDEQGLLLERLIDFVFDILEVRHVELRVIDTG